MAQKTYELMTGSAVWTWSRKLARSRAYAMACGTYPNEVKQEGLPSKEMIRAAVKEALSAKSDQSKSSLVMVGSVFAAILASLCCILPIVFGLTGLTVLGASAAFATWRPYLLTVTFGLLGAGFYFGYRPAKAECAPGSACAIQRGTCPTASHRPN